MTVLAIDPGPTESAYVVLQRDLRPTSVGKVPNKQLLSDLHGWLGLHGGDGRAVEMVASYGMAVGAEVFDTCVWIGRFAEAIDQRTGLPPQLVKRNPIKVHICHDSRAKDGNIIQALVDRFAQGEPNRGKGTKANPGWFYGFTGDIWQAYALAVYVADQAATS